MATSLQEIIKSVRELSFDRFVSPTFFIASRTGGDVLTVTADSIKITNGTTVKTELLFTDYPTLQDIVSRLIADPARYSVAYGASFIGNEPSNSLLVLNDIPIEESYAVTRKNFFSDTFITNEIIQYFKRVLCIPCDKIDDTTINDAVEEQKCPRAEHIALWVAFWIVDKRRVYELAGEMLGSLSSYSGSGENSSIGGMSGVNDLEMKIGDVFTLRNNRDNQYNKGEEPWRVGADNVLGDADSFWYKLMLWIRDRIENFFGDYSLRKDNVIPGHIILEKDTNWYAYYDSYPYTVSPLTRSILSSGNWNSANGYA